MSTAVASGTEGIIRQRLYGAYVRIVRDGFPAIDGQATHVGRAYSGETVVSVTTDGAELGWFGLQEIRATAGAWLAITNAESAL